eukprot:CAMPEP_0196158776 /NCGR_PEP_ID=MMETSP0910-20130528/45984_1 /TAXON_ID=49265 /ORGANISM="Thalassiosira rotula, Strain GSO102" /LENGTH=311 /DNA_ID=CAMNT_0041423687 /DNA_START=252 /DNA_END=1185 /DNA_ORIENTATION=-
MADCTSSSDDANVIRQKEPTPSHQQQQQQHQNESTIKSIFSGGETLRSIQDRTGTQIATTTTPKRIHNQIHILHAGPTRQHPPRPNRRRFPPLPLLPRARIQEFSRGESLGSIVASRLSHEMEVEIRISGEVGEGVGGLLFDWFGWGEEEEAKGGGEEDDDGGRRRRERMERRRMEQQEEPPSVQVDESDSSFNNDNDNDNDNNNNNTKNNNFWKSRYFAEERDATRTRISATELEKLVFDFRFWIGQPTVVDGERIVVKSGLLESASREVRFSNSAPIAMDGGDDGAESDDDDDDDEWSLLAEEFPGGTW